jgi:hypothetical protein
LPGISKHQVRTIQSVQRVTPVAHHDVVTVAAEQDVIARAIKQDVLVVPAEQYVIAVAFKPLWDVLAASIGYTYRVWKSSGLLRF